MVLVKNGANKDVSLQLFLFDLQIKFEAFAPFDKWQGKTALEIAQQCEYRDIITVLSSYPADDRNKMQEGTQTMQIVSHLCRNIPFKKSNE